MFVHKNNIPIFDTFRVKQKFLVYDKKGNSRTTIIINNTITIIIIAIISKNEFDFITKKLN